MRKPSGRRLPVGVPIAVISVAVALSGCGGDPSPANAAAHGRPTAVRLGYFPNLTHATAIVGVEKGLFATALGSAATLRTSTFNAGPAAVEALFGGAIDAAYIGPGPTTNAFVKSGGKAIRVISGATSGGAALVVDQAIGSAGQLRGKKIATPQLGNTQDIALRYWLEQQGLATDAQGGGDVHILPQENSQTLDTFAAGQVDGAWVPEPYASRMVAAGGKVLVDERSLWPGGRFVTTNLVVRTRFLAEHPAVVKRLLEGQVAANAFVNDHPAAAQRLVGTAIGRLTGKPLEPEVVADAWKSLTFTDDPVPGSLLADARHAAAVGLLKDAKLDGLYDLRLLNEVLTATGQKEVTQP